MQTNKNIIIFRKQEKKQKKDELSVAKLTFYITETADAWPKWNADSLVIHQLQEEFL